MNKPCIESGLIRFYTFQLNCISLLLCTLFFFPANSPGNEVETEVINTPGVTLVFEPHLRSAAEEAVEMYPDIKTSLEKLLRWEINFRPVIMMISNHHDFQKMTGNELIVAFAASDQNLIVIDYTKMHTDPFTLEATMKHELCHLLLHNYIKRENLPRYFDEGIAQWSSGGLADIITGKSNSVLDEAVLSDSCLGLRVLTADFPGDKRHLILAYEESKSFVEYIIREYHLEAVLLILEQLKGGQDMDHAVQASLSLSFGELEKGWYTDIKNRITWLTFLLNNLYEILFFVSSLLLCLAYVKAVLKKRAYEKETEDEGNMFH